LPAGYLEKQQRKGTKAWQSRWFELDGVQLRYYKSAKDVEQGTPALGMVWVQDLLSVRVLQGADHQRCFLLETHRDEKPQKPRVFTLKAATDPLVSQWIEALERSRRVVAELALDKSALVSTEPAPEPSPVSATQTRVHVGLPTHEGYLLKQNPRGLWQKRWCVLEGGRLHYKSDKKSGQAKTIDLRSCESVDRDAIDTHGISINVEGRVFNLLADSETDADMWLELLQLSCAQAAVAEKPSVQPESCQLLQEWSAGADSVREKIREFVAGAFSAGPSIVAALSAAETVLQRMVRVPVELAGTGRQDIADFHLCEHHRQLAKRLSAAASRYPDIASWTRFDALAFTVWCGEYSERLSQVATTTLPSQLPEHLPVLALLTEEFMPECEGYAKKRSPKGGGKMQVWQNRWFELRRCILSYYRDQKHDGAPLGTIEMAQVSSLIRKDDSADIKMIVAGRKIVIRFATDEDAMLWLARLHTSCEAGPDAQAMRHGAENIVSETAATFDSTSRDEILAGIGERFSKITSCEGDIVATLAAAEDLVVELTVLLDDVACCQPPRQDISTFYVEEFHQRLYNALLKFLGDSSLVDMEAQHILQMVAWVYSMYDRLGKLGCDPPDKLTLVESFQQMLEHVPSMSGFLFKMSPRAKGMRAWQRRWFVLKHCRLYYFKQQPASPDETAQGEIRLDQLQSLTLAGSGLGMKLVLSSRAYYLKVPTEDADQLEKWVAAIDNSTLRGIVKTVGSGETNVTPTGPQSTQASSSRPQPSSRSLATPESIVTDLQSVLMPRSSTATAEDLHQDLDLASATVVRIVSVLDGMIFDGAEDRLMVTLASQCHEIVADRIQAYIGGISSFEQSMIHSVLAWMSVYHDELGEHSAVLVPRLHELGFVQPLLERYQSNMVNTVTTWCENLLKLESESAESVVEHSEEEGLHTQGPVDLLKMLNQQVATAHATAVQQFTFHVLLACGAVFTNFQRLLTAHITANSALPIEYLCATVNNCGRMMELCTGLGEQAELILDERLASRLGSEESAEGFLSVAKTTIEAVVGVVMLDVEPLFSTAFTDAWAEQMEVVVATIGDFCSDLHFWLQTHFFKRVVSGILDRIVYMYVKSLLTKKIKPSKGLFRRVERDLAELALLADASSGFVSPKTLARRVYPVECVADLLRVQEPNLAKKFSGQYQALLDAHPDANLVLDRIINLRSDLKKNQRRVIAEQCRSLAQTAGSASNIGVFARVVRECPAAFTS
jgi:hypothetical protein